MTDTNCPDCNVLLDLPKYATGKCEWCGTALPAEHVAHARQRVAQRKAGHDRVSAFRESNSAVPPASPGLMNAGTGAILVLALAAGLTALRGGQLFYDLSQPYIYIAGAAVLTVVVGLGWAMTRRVKSKA